MGPVVERGLLWRRLVDFFCEPTMGLHDFLFRIDRVCDHGSVVGTDRGAAFLGLALQLAAKG
jgi:hypothetical protein